MKRFVGYLVEGKLENGFGDVWVRLGLSRSYLTAQKLAGIAEFGGHKPCETRITPYYRVAEPHAEGSQQTAQPATKRIGSGSDSTLVAA